MLTRGKLLCRVSSTYSSNIPQFHQPSCRLFKRCRVSCSWRMWQIGQETWPTLQRRCIGEPAACSSINDAQLELVCLSRCKSSDCYLTVFCISTAEVCVSCLKDSFQCTFEPAPRPNAFVSTRLGIQYTLFYVNLAKKKKKKV